MLLLSHLELIERHQFPRHLSNFGSSLKVVLFALALYQHSAVTYSLLLVLLLSNKLLNQRLVG
jgi:hypothetical protein